MASSRPHPLPRWSLTHPPNVHWMCQFAYFCRLFERIRTVQGYVVECGVGYGWTFLMLAYLAQQTKRKLYGFDSFLGFPEPTPEDRSWRKVKRGDWSGPTERDVGSALLASGILAKGPDCGIYTVPGYFVDTLPLWADHLTPIAFLHLDVDLYMSYKTCLEYLFPAVGNRGIICLDEYREYSPSHPDEEKWPGATKAIDEYLKPRGYLPILDEDSGKYYVVKI